MLVTEIGRQCRAITLGFTCSVSMGRAWRSLLATLTPTNPTRSLAFLRCFSFSSSSAQTPNNKDSKFTISKILSFVRIGKCLHNKWQASNTSHERSLFPGDRITTQPHSPPLRVGLTRKRVPIVHRVLDRGKER